MTRADDREQDVSGSNAHVLGLDGWMTRADDREPRRRQIEVGARLVVWGYQLGARAARLVPVRWAGPLARLAAPLLVYCLPRRAALVARHQARALRWQSEQSPSRPSCEPTPGAASPVAAAPAVFGARSLRSWAARAARAAWAAASPFGSASRPTRGTASPVAAAPASAARDRVRADAAAVEHRLAVRAATVAAFASYAQYWLESFRLPAVRPHELDAGIDVPDYRYVEQALERGNGAILALPHLGGWEWAGFWIAACQRLPITVVVERLEPPELFDWFVGFRRRLGMNVVPLGPRAGAEAVAALRRNEIVCLLCDRDLTGDGIETDFGGEPVTLPAGPAILALRTGAALLPTAVYFRPAGRHLGVVRPPLDTDRRGVLRTDAARITQDLADALVGLIARDPAQWHLFTPH